MVCPFTNPVTHRPTASSSIVSVGNEGKVGLTDFWAVMLWPLNLTVFHFPDVPEAGLGIGVLGKIMIAWLADGTDP